MSLFSFISGVIVGIAITLGGIYFFGDTMVGMSGTLSEQLEVLSKEAQQFQKRVGQPQQPPRPQRPRTPEVPDEGP